MSDYLINFATYYKPAPQGSKTATGQTRATKSGGRTPVLRESSAGVKPFREAIGWNAKMAIRKLPAAERKQFPLEGPLVARMVFTVTRRTRGKNFADAPSVMPDVSKYVRAAEDAVKNIIWTDDGRVVGYDLVWKTYPGRHPEALDKAGLVMAVRRATHAELGLDPDLLQGRKYTELLEKWAAGG